MRTVWAWLNRWPDGWWGVAWAVVTAFAISTFAGLVLLNRGADFALPMAAAVAVGAGLGQAYRVLWPKPEKAPAWPTSTPPPGRPD